MDAVVQYVCSIHPAIISSIIATIVSTTVSLVLWLKSNRQQERRSIQDMIAKLIDMGIAYPYLENDEFCEKWTQTSKSSDEGMRYDNYCCFLFNLLQRLWEFCGGNESKMKGILHYSELIERHRKWWNGESENRAGYPKKFRAFVGRQIKPQDTRDHLKCLAKPS